MAEGSKAGMASSKASLLRKEERALAVPHSLSTFTGEEGGRERKAGEGRKKGARLRGCELLNR
jgi:hypothetical protein